MANIAQIANVLQSMVLTRGDKMVLTPTYHTFRMYNVHQDAMYLPSVCDSPKFKDSHDRECPYVDVTASKNAEGKINITLTNTSLDQKADVSIEIPSLGKAELSGEILTSKNVQDHNEFDRPDTVRPVEFDDFKIKDGKIIVKMPPMSIISLSAAL